MPVISSVSNILSSTSRYAAHAPGTHKIGIGAFMLAVFGILSFLPVHRAVAQRESVSFPVTQQDETTRSMALGGRSPALLSSDASALFSNAALLSTAMHRTVSISYLNHLAGINSGSVAYATTLDSLTTAAIGIRYLSFGSIERTDELGNRNGSFSAADFDLAMSLSRKIITGLRAGASIHFLRSSLDDESASALTIDGGLVYEISRKALSFGLVVQQVGITMSSIGRSDSKPPIDVRVGMSKKLAHIPLLMTISFFRLNELGEAPDHLSAFGQVMYHTILGSEFQFSRNFQVRIGYNFRRHDELSLKSRLDFSGVSTGFGLRISNIGIDYGFSSWSSIGGLHRFTVRTRL